MKAIYRQYANNDLKFAKWFEQIDERINELTGRTFADYREIAYRSLYDRKATIDEAIKELARSDGVFRQHAKL